MPARIVEAWKNPDPALATRIQKFWDLEVPLPPDVDPAVRLKEVCAVALERDRVVGLTTALVGHYEPLRCNFAFYRCAVATDYRRGNVATHLTFESFKFLSQWSEVNQHLHVKGLLAVIQAEPLRKFQEQPIWEYRGKRMYFVGYAPAGHQVRVAWFDRVRL